MVVYSCPKGDTLIVLVDLNATTALTKLTITHVLVLTALDYEIKLLIALRLCEKSETQDS